MKQSEPWPTPERAAAWRPAPQVLPDNVVEGFTHISVPVREAEMRAWRGEYAHHFGREWSGPSDLLSTLLGESESGAHIFSRMWETDNRPNRPRQPPKGGRRAMGRRIGVSEALVNVAAVLGGFLALCLVAAAFSWVLR